MNKAFTLIEVLIGISIFMVVIVSFLGLFGSAFSAQRRNLNAAYLLDNVSFTAEYMSRAIRMAQKDLLGTCIGSKNNFEIGTNSIKFLNCQPIICICQEFFLQNQVIMVDKNGVSQPLTPSNLIVEKLNFEVLGQSQDDLIQPRITFGLQVRTEKEPYQSINIQTTVSQRQLDIQY